MHDLDLAAPYTVAIALYLLSPRLSELVKFAVKAAINKGRVEQPTVNDADIPFYLMPPMIDDYIEYAADAAQVFPALLLPIVGAVYGFTGGIPAPVSVTFLLVACLAAIAMMAWMLTVPPSDYVYRKWSGYSLLTAAGIALNLAGMTLALTLSLLTGQRMIAEAFPAPCDPYSGAPSFRRSAQRSTYADHRRGTSRRRSEGA